MKRNFTRIFLVFFHFQWIFTRSIRWNPVLIATNLFNYYKKESLFARSISIYLCKCTRNVFRKKWKHSPTETKTSICIYHSSVGKLVLLIKYSFFYLVFILFLCFVSQNLIFAIHLCVFRIFHKINTHTPSVIQHLCGFCSFSTCITCIWRNVRYNRVKTIL